MDLTPQQIAALDQAHAAGNTDLDAMVERVRSDIRDHGVVVAGAMLTAELQTVEDTDYLGALAGLAVGRLAQAQKPGRHRAPEDDHLPGGA